MSVTRSFILGVVAMATSVARSIPASASAAPSYATAYALPLGSSGAQKYVFVEVQPTYLDKTSRALSVRYEAGSFIFVDTGGIVAIPGLIGVPGGNGCFAAGTDAVRCPVDLGDPGIIGMRFHMRQACPTKSISSRVSSTGARVYPASSATPAVSGGASGQASGTSTAASTFG
jgi:hypothetical protein